jgi:uncharacterized phage-associated protein
MHKEDTVAAFSEEELDNLQSSLSNFAYRSPNESTDAVPDLSPLRDAKPLRTETVSPPKPAVSALDVAEYILRKTGTISTMKLQKLVYYCQAWSLVWDEAPLFHENIEAWTNGPVIRELFNYHRGMFDIEHVMTGNPELLSDVQRVTIDAVLDFYGGKSAQYLIELSHSEEPWQEARRGFSDSDRGTRTISLDSMANYYSSLTED